MAASANALYVVRLVLGARLPCVPAAVHAVGRLPRRHFSTAALSQQADSPSAFFSATPSSTTEAATDSAAVTNFDFLEPESNEYEEAEEFLPARPPAEPAPIPWPTVFRHGATPAQQAKPRKPCDLLARLVAENKLDQARKVHAELTALHVVPVYRKVYLKAALSSLQPTPQGRADFLFWLELYPNRAATINHPAFRETWEPIVARILTDHLDVDFITKFIELAARKALLPAIIRHFIQVLVTMMSPRKSEVLMQRAMDAYTDVTVSKKSKSRRARHYSDLAIDQVNEWWNLYLRALATAGYVNQARALLYSPPAGVAWSAFSRSIVLEESGPKAQQALEQRRIKESGSAMEALQEFEKAPSWVGQPLSKLINSALRSPTFPDVSMLACIQDRLLGMPERSRLLARFRQRFTQPPSTPRSRQMPTTADVWWWHAELTRLVKAKSHKEALEKFRSHFLWMGLPPVSAPEERETSVKRLVPTSKVITTVIPSILNTIPPTEWAKFHATYLDHVPSLAPSLRPTEFTHLSFVREIAYHLGPADAKNALNAILQRNMDPGLPAWNAFLLALAGRGRFEAVLHVLRGMERGKKMGGRELPAPNYRTYMGLIRLCSNNGNEEWTRKFLQQLYLFHKDVQLGDIPEGETPKSRRHRRGSKASKKDDAGVPSDAQPESPQPSSSSQSL